MRLRAMVAGLALLALAGCGLRLAGTEVLPPVLAAPYIEQEDAQSAFGFALARALAASGSQQASSRDEATAVVRILRDETSERVLSVSARNLPREYELTHRVEIAVDVGTAQWLAPEELMLTREFTFDEATLLAKEREQAILEAALAEDLARIVMRRLAALAPPAK